jgi:hypothetical protein
MGHSLLMVFIVWVVDFGSFSVAARKQVAQAAARIKAPIVVKYYLLLLPVVLLEEVLTIEVPYFWGILPMVVAFSIVFLPIFMFQRLTRCSYLAAAAVAGCLGWVNEFLIVGRISLLQGPTLLVMSILGWLIYAVMAILPAAYLQWELSLGRRE